MLQLAASPLMKTYMYTYGLSLTTIAILLCGPHITIKGIIYICF